MIHTFKIITILALIFNCSLSNAFNASLYKKYSSIYSFHNKLDYIDIDTNIDLLDYNMSTIGGSINWEARRQLVNKLQSVKEQSKQEFLKIFQELNDKPKSQEFFKKYYLKWTVYMDQKISNPGESKESHDRRVNLSKSSVTDTWQAFELELELE